MCLDDRRVKLVSLVMVTAYEIVVIVVVRVVRDGARVVTRASTASWPVAVVSCCRGRRCSRRCSCSIRPSALSATVLSLGVLLGLHPPVLEPDQVWSPTQFYYPGFSQSRIKHTFKVCVSCS